MPVPVGSATIRIFDLHHLFKAFSAGESPFCVESPLGAFLLNSCNS